MWDSHRPLYGVWLNAPGKAVVNEPFVAEASTSWDRDSDVFRLYLADTATDARFDPMVQASRETQKRLLADALHEHPDDLQAKKWLDEMLSQDRHEEEIFAKNFA